MGTRTKLVGVATGVAVLGLSIVVVAPAQATPGTASASFVVSGHADVNVTEDSWCDNAGPHITLAHTIAIGGGALQLTFKNNVKGTHTVQVVGAVTLSLLDTSGDSTPQIAKQPPLGGVGGNPFIYYRSPDGVNHYIGRCVQDGKIGHLNHGRWSSDFGVNGFSTSTVQAVSCSNKGSSLNIGHTASTDGVDGTLVFSNSDLGLNPQHINDTDVAASWTFSLAGSQIRKGQHNGVPGPGGNPLVSTATGPTVGGVTVFGAPTDHGRCNKLY
jgi:hypothetical protein